MQMMGGRFRSIMPSDLFKPGAMARESLRAPGRDYASTVNREELQRLMRRYVAHLFGKLSNLLPVCGPCIVAIWVTGAAKGVQMDTFHV